MVKIGLQFKAFLEFVTEILPEGEDFRWYFKFKCSNCSEIPEHHQYIARSESQALKGGRGEANLVMKCKLCGRDNSIDILEDSIKSYDAADSNQFKTIVVFDCRGVEPVEFSPRNGWNVKGYKENDDGEGATTGTLFEDVDLTEKEWADYDEKSDESTCISEMEFKFVKVK